MITTIYVNHKTELEDYVTNIALISFYCKKGMFQIFVSKPSEKLFGKNLLSYSRSTKTNEICSRICVWFGLRQVHIYGINISFKRL